MDKKEKVAAVVVTYNRKALLVETLPALLGQTRALDALFVIDNASTDGTEEAVRPFLEESDIIVYKRLPQNIGGAGGFCEGIRAAYDAGFDYIWGMDDDAVPAPDALAVLMTAKAAFSPKTVMWSNIVMHDEAGVPVVHWRAFSVPVQEERGFTFVGFLIPRQLVTDIGLPRADLFILYDEVDYSRKAVSRCYKIIRCRDSKIYHPYINSVESRKCLGIKINILRMANWKWYYFIRNGILIYSWQERQRYRVILLTFWILLKSLLVDRANLKMIIRGTVDGILGKAGRRDFAPPKKS